MPEKGLDVKSLVKKIYAEDKSYCWDRDFTQIGILSNPFLTYIVHRCWQHLPTHLHY